MRSFDALNRLHRACIALFLACAGLGVWGCAPQLMFGDEPAAGVTIRGVVLSEGEALAGASVRVQATEFQAVSDENGAFAIPNVTASLPLTVVAWSKNYFLNFAVASSVDSSVEITLTQHHRSDNLESEWETSANCGECHTAYAEWQADAHGQSALNQRFLTIYRGTDIDGNRSPNTDFDAGFPSLPDLSEPYYGPGFKTDFPERDGNCAACHTPTASNLPTTNTCGWSGCHRFVTIERSDELPHSVTPVGLSGVAAEGISCDFCHKIARVRVDEETGLPPHDRPGIMSMSIYRPAPGETFFMGSLDDVARTADSYNALYEESLYCASCHYGVFSNTVVYNSYGEWLESPYSEPDGGQTCQDCHMPVAEPYPWPSQDARSLTGLASMPPLLAAVAQEESRNFFVYPNKGGVMRVPEQVHNHRMPGAADPEFLRSAVQMTTDVRLTGDRVHVDVHISNTGAGHHVPTGSPLRQMLLVLEVVAADGSTVEQIAGSVLPDWAGDLAARPGKGYAKILRDSLTGEMPSISHWRLLDLAADTRIPALATDVTRYEFDAVEDAVTVTARLFFRRGFHEIMEWKGWTDPDILMAENVVHLTSE